jgi:hypothetical protein
MSQNRDAPAYQEYAASIMARLPFRTMTLQDRGLLFTMRLECWVNVRLPNNPSDLAKVLGLPPAEVTNSLVAVMPFFEVVDGFVICPELEDYRAHLAERKRKQSQGGKLGSAITNRRCNGQTETENDEVSSTPSSTSRLARRDSRVSLVQPSPKKPSQNQSQEKVILTDPCIAEDEAAESCTAEAYSKARDGR